MKTLVVFYSRTGYTRKAAKKIAERLKADFEEITDNEDRSGVLGYMKCGRDAFRKTIVKINPIKYDPSGYDLVVIGTPVWSFTMCAPIRTYISQNLEKLKKMKLAFLCTCDNKAYSTFKDLEDLCGKRPLGSIALKSGKIKKGEYGEEFDMFISTLTG